MLGPNAKKFHEDLQNILKYQKDNLIQREAWGTSNFHSYESEFDEIFFFANEFSKLDISYIPDGNFDIINQSLSHIISIFKIIDDYDVSTQRKQDIDAKCNSLNTYIIKLKEFSAAWLPILAYKRGDIDEKLSRLEEVQKEAEYHLTRIKELQTSYEEEGNKILQAMREASASAGVAVFNQDFKEAADHNQTDATYWGYWLIALSVITIFFPIITYIWTPPYESLLVLISSKILVMAVLITASLWVGRMYKSSKHQEAVNLFKANALLTFQAFIKATDDEQTKNAVLLETTKAIFTGFNPGYISTEPTTSDSLKIMEIFKNIPQKE